MSARRAGALALLLALAGCGAQQEPPPRPPVFARVVAVLPFETAPSADRGERRGETTAGDLVTAQVYRVLSAQTVYLVVPDLTVADTLAMPEVRRTVGQLDRAVALGRAVGADAVVIGRVTRFEQRVGTAYGASEGAAVAFEMGIVSVADREGVWRGEFEERQEELSSNVFDVWMFWDKGPRWLSATELAGLGVDQLFDDLRDAVTAEREEAYQATMAAAPPTPAP